MTILRALLLGLALMGGLALTAGSLVGCGGDPGDPLTHVGYLSDPVKRPAAVKRLIQFYEDAMTNDKKNREGKHVKPLLDKIVQPLTKVALEGTLDTRTQGKLLSFLADCRDLRALPALTKALAEYRPDDKKASEFDSQILEVVRNVGELAGMGKLADAKEIKAALIKIFVNMRASSPKAQNSAFFRVLNHTMVIIGDPSWKSQLIALLKRPIKSAKQKHLKTITNEVYWQITAAEILGKLKAADAVRPLIKVVLSPFKANVQTTAINALIKIGKPAIDAGMKLLEGQDEELAKYAYDEYIRAATDRGEDPDKNKSIKVAAKAAPVQSAAIIVANIGRKECVEPMLAALAKGDKVTKAVIGRELYKLPAGTKTTDAFKEVYTATGVDLKIPPNVYAKEQLVESAGSFFDPHLSGWLAEDALELKGEKEDVESVQLMVLSVAMKAATKEQWPSVEKLVAKMPEVKTGKKTYYIKGANEKKEEGPFSEKQVVDKILALELQQGTARENKKGEVHQALTKFSPFLSALNNAAYLNAYRIAKKTLDTCGEKMDCYFAKLTSPEAGKQKTQMVGLKSAYMIGLLGGPGVKLKLVGVLPRVSNAAVRFVISLIIDRKSPKGDPAIAKKLRAMVDKAAATRDRKRISRVKPLKQVIYRLEARAQ